MKSVRKTNPGPPHRVRRITFLPGPRGQRKEVRLSAVPHDGAIPAARAPVRLCDVCGDPFDAESDERLCPICSQRKH